MKNRVLGIVLALFLVAPSGVWAQDESFEDEAGQSEVTGVGDFDLVILKWMSMQKGNYVDSGAGEPDFVVVVGLNNGKGGETYTIGRTQVVRDEGTRRGALTDPAILIIPGEKINIGYHHLAKQKGGMDPQSAQLVFSLVEESKLPVMWDWVSNFWVDKEEHLDERRILLSDLAKLSDPLTVLKSASRPAKELNFSHADMEVSASLDLLSYSYQHDKDSISYAAAKEVLVTDEEICAQKGAKNVVEGIVGMFWDNDIEGFGAAQNFGAPFVGVQAGGVVTDAAAWLVMTKAQERAVAKRTRILHAADAAKKDAMLAELSAKVDDVAAAGKPVAAAAGAEAALAAETQGAVRAGRKSLLRRGIGAVVRAPVTTVRGVGASKRFLGTVARKSVAWLCVVDFVSRPIAIAGGHKDPGYIPLWEAGKKGVREYRAYVGEAPAQRVPTGDSPADRKKRALEELRK